MSHWWDRGNTRWSTSIGTPLNSGGRWITFLLLVCHCCSSSVQGIWGWLKALHLSRFGFWRIPEGEILNDTTIFLSSFGWKFWKLWNETLDQELSIILFICFWTFISRFNSCNIQLNIFSCIFSWNLCLQLLCRLLPWVLLLLLPLTQYPFYSFRTAVAVSLALVLTRMVRKRC